MRIYDIMMFLWIIVMKIIDVITTRIGLTLKNIIEIMPITAYLIEKYGIDRGLILDSLLSFTVITITLIVTIMYGEKRFEEYLKHNPNYNHKEAIKFLSKYLWLITATILFLIPITFIVFNNLIGILKIMKMQT